MQTLLFFIFVAAAIAMARKLANLGSDGPRSSRQRIGGGTSPSRAGAQSGGSTLRDDPLADTLKAWVEGRAKTRGPSPPPLPVEAELRPIEYESSSVPSAPAPAWKPEASIYPPTPGKDTAQQGTAQNEAAQNEAAQNDVVRSEPRPVDAPVRATRAPRLASASGPLTSEANTLHSTASEDASDLASALEGALGDAAQSPAGPSLALSSSLTRPASLVYSACLFLGGFEPSAANRAFRRIADRSRFFGLGLADPAQLGAVHLASAVADLRRASTDLMAAIETDLERLDAELLASEARPAGRAAVERLRALIRPRDGA
ncbi:hypothetical protein Pla163_27180 [Planctomycetes bacterium Pla163]|uniref:Uncharacterized protein n=1 Tax=Rohdeia mirabilis TaxID=2528008 RepID=A0A518D285_9BACT|nr:hypothetical protein Pla163_27180 [Planctomycetes bacterium Pla163]